MKQQNARTINAMIIFALLSTSLCFDYIPSPITEYSPGKSGNSDTLPVVTYLSNDKYVITWTGVINSTTSNIWISAYDSTGKNLLAATKVNTNTGYNCYSWAAPDTAGGFVVVWNSRDGASMCCNVNDIQATYYNSAFTAGTQFKVNSMVVGNANRDYAYPSVAWNSSTFLVGFNLDNPNNGYYTVMEERITIGLAATTSGVPKNMTSTLSIKNEYKIVAAYLNNGIWATAWQSDVISPTDMDILYSLTNDSTSVQSVVPTRINTNTTGAQINPSIITLSTNNFVVAWQDDNGTGGQVIMAQLMTQAGAKSGTNFKVNTVSTCTSPNVATLGGDGFVVTYKCNPTGTANAIYYQLYTTAAVKISTERQVNTISANLNVTPFAVGKAATNFMVVYSTGSLNYAQHFYKDTNACANFTVYYGVGNAPKLKIPFSTTDANYWVKPVSLPSNGTLKTSAGQALTTTGLNTDTDVYYYFSTPASDNFTFTTNYVDTTCKVTLSLCYTSCGTCSGSGSSPANNCLTCNTAASYYPVEDDPITCTTTAPTTNYVLDTTTHVWRHCYSACKTCSALPTDPTVNMFCSTCQTNYYAKQDNTTSCFTGTVPGYYFVSPLYKNCYSSCLSCTAYPTDPTVNMFCSTCISGYYTKVDNTTSCFTGTVQGYYLNGTVYSKCYVNCKTCTTYPTDYTIDMKCASNSCISAYYPKVDNMTSCFTGTLNFYFLDTDNIYKLCYSTCKTCTTLGDINDHKCGTCQTNYYPKSDKTTSCFTGTQSGYVFNVSIYQKCYSSCDTCTTIAGTTSNHQCQTCLNGYYPLVDNTTSCFTGPQLNYYFDINIYRKCYSTCSACATLGNATNNQCTQCISSYYQKVDDMTNCFTSPQSKYYLDGTNIFQKCYSTCDTCNTTPGNSSNHQCTNCIIGYYPKNDNMTSCFTGPQSSYYLSGSVYQKCFSTCQTCNATGNSSNHQCQSCLSGYFPKVDNMTSCFTGTQSKYYLDTNLYKQCYSTCDTCNTIGDINNHQCNTCYANYFPMIDKMNNCYTGPQDHYYLDGNNIYQKCHQNCKTCKVKAIDDDHQQCDTCLDTYYPKEDNLKSCYTDQQSGYFIENNLYKKCHQLCKTCNTVGTDLDNKCLTCINNYYPRSDNLTNCFTGTPPEKYFFDKNIYRNCYLSCETCFNVISTPQDHQCKICAKNYMNIGDGNNCVLIGAQLPGLYYDAIEKIYKPCYPSCMFCRGKGDKGNNNCIGCANGFYRSINDMVNQCYPKDERLPFQYFDESKQLFEQCYNSCKTCTKYGTAAEHNCNECRDSHAPLYEDKSMCFQSTEQIQGHLFDFKLNVFKQCYESCDSCFAIGDEFSHSCTACKDGYFNTIVDNSLCHKSDEIVRGYFFDKETNLFKKCYETCNLCYGPGTLRDPNCSECKDTAAGCFKCTDYIYNDTCVKTCPTKTVKDVAKQECYDCINNQIVFKNTCVDECPEGYTRQSDTCVTCQSLNKYYYNGNCVDSCPDKLMGNSSYMCKLYNFELKGKINFYFRF
jgi:hypothetical protein